MPRDYAKSSRPRARRRPAPKKQSNKLWLVAVALTALFVAGLVFLKQENIRLSGQRPLLTTTQPHSAAVHTNATTATTTATSPRFDFYTMLPKVHVTTNQEQQREQEQQLAATTATPVTSGTNNASSTSSATPSSNSQIASPPTPVTASYILQLGVFKEYAAADELKAQVVLLGFEANVKAIKQNSLYRVWIGPFKTRMEAKAQQKGLTANQIKSALVKETA